MGIITGLKKSRLFRISIHTLVAVWIWAYCLPGSLVAESQQLEKAIGLYQVGEFDRAISMITACIEGGSLDKADMAKAYKYLAEAYISKSLEQQAKDAIEKLLKLVPDYRPNRTTDRDEFVELVEEVREELPPIPPPPPPKPKWIYYVAGGVLLIAGIVLIAGGGGDGEASLPAPPSLPAN